MKATIDTRFYVRGKPITSTHSFPVYSDKIEETMIRSFDFLNQYDKFSLTLKVTKNDD